MLASIILAREDEVKCLHFLMIIMDSFLGQHNPSNYFALTIHYHDNQIPYRTVEYVIWKIRKKMGYDIIETLVNVGYRLKKL